MSRKAKLKKLKRPDSTVTQDEELIAEDCWNFFDAESYSTVADLGLR